MRQIVLDTETTGLDPKQGHRIIEIGCVELVNRKLTGNHYHQYIQPDREVDEGAIEVHGITNEFLQDKPRFEDINDDFVSFIRGAELVIHNAPFDVGFMDSEWLRLDKNSELTTDLCTVLDTLTLARKMHPGQRNSLDALCKRYFIDNTQREKHGALLDAEILADVYLAMTGGQASLSLGSHQEENTGSQEEALTPVNRDGIELFVQQASGDEAEAHEHYLDMLDKASGNQCVWRQSKTR